MTFDEAMKMLPLVAIIRGVRPDEVVAIVGALHRAGIRLVEVPLNSPEPLASIAAVAEQFGGRMICGAGTVLEPEQVQQVADVGGQFIVSPNVDPVVIAASLKLELTPLPGFFSPSEALLAIKAGARFLKLFPASTAGLGHLLSIRAVFGRDIQVLPVGGVGPDAMADWRRAGAAGFGLGSDLYRPGQSPETTYENAARAVAALRACL